MHDQIMRPGGQIQHLLVRDDFGAGQDFRPGLQKRRHHSRRCKGSVNLVQSLLQFDGGVVVQEQLGPKRAGAGAVAQKGGAVGQARGLGHGQGKR